VCYVLGVEIFLFKYVNSFNFIYKLNLWETILRTELCLYALLVRKMEIL